jgi:hypothetical protein
VWCDARPVGVAAVKNATSGKFVGSRKLMAES